MNKQKHADELIKALKDFTTIIPDGAALRRYVGKGLDGGPMSPEEFVAFAGELLVVVRKIRKKYDEK